MSKPKGHRVRNQDEYLELDVEHENKPHDNIEFVRETVLLDQQNWNPDRDSVIMYFILGLCFPPFMWYAVRRYKDDVDPSVGNWLKYARYMMKIQIVLIVLLFIVMASAGGSIIYVFWDLFAERYAEYRNSVDYGNNQPYNPFNDTTWK